jgi:dTDP-4-dehydrorhamnose 3,5-epimerase
MRFEPLGLDGAWLIEPEPHCDRRGTFARTFCAREFGQHSLETVFVQHSTSHTLLRGTVRGMHFQRQPHAEVKIVNCTRGAIYDVIVDLRRASPTYLQWRGVELSSEKQRRLYIPKGFAHGFQTLTNGADVSYLISSYYEPTAADGVRHDDPSFGIEWPVPVAALSDKDATWPDYRA